MQQPSIKLTDKRAGVLRHYRHPWVFSRGIHSADSAAGAGDLVAVRSRKGELLGQAFYHPKAALALRMVTFDDATVDGAFWQARLLRAFQLRQRLLPDASSYRLAHGENDGLPGLTVDVFGELAVLAITCQGMEAIKSELAQGVMEICGCKAVYEVSVGHARKQEGLPERREWLVGTLDLPVQVEEHGLRYLVDPSQGHKTGFYLDQRPQRDWMGSLCRGLRVLDLCCYSGGFSMAALRGGAAEVLSVDASQSALDLLQQHLELNQLASDRHTALKTDVFEYLKQKPDAPYDVVILDPPALAKSVRNQEKALRGYRHLNRDVAKWVKPGGLLLTFSCSGVIKTSDFRQSVFLGMRDADVSARLVRPLSPGLDHPVDLQFPEGEYLKGLALILTSS